MSKQAEKVSTEVAVIPQTTAEIVTGLNAQNDIKMLAALEGMAALPQDNFVKISADYFEPKIGETYNIAVTGISTLAMPDQTNPGQMKEFEAVTFCLKEKGELKNYIFGGAVLVSGVKREMEKDKTAGVGGRLIGLRMKITGEEKSAKGKYLTMELSRIFA